MGGKLTSIIRFIRKKIRISHNGDLRYKKDVYKTQDIDHGQFCKAVTMIYIFWVCLAVHNVQAFLLRIFFFYLTADLIYFLRQSTEHRITFCRLFHPHTLSAILMMSTFRLSYLPIKWLTRLYTACTVCSIKQGDIYHTVLLQIIYQKL